MTAAVQPKARARYAAKRDAIMGAATKVFADQGMSGFTLAAVAKRMDLHPVSLTYYFKRKEDLAAAVLHDAIRRFGGMLEKAEVETTAPARLRALVEAYFETRQRVALGDEIPLAPFNEINLIEGEQHGPLMEAFRTIYLRIGRLLKSDDMPWMTPPRRQALARLVVNALTWSDSWIGSYPPEDYPRVAARMADLMIGGLADRDARLVSGALLPLGSPTAGNDEVTRDRFLVAATKLINQEGYRGASVDKISAQLKVTKGSFYHHNADKDELAAACFGRTFAIIDDARRRAASQENGLQRLGLAIASLSEHQAAGDGGRILRHYALAAVPPAMRKQMLMRFQQIAHAFSGVIADGIADGSIRPVDALLAAQYVMVIFNVALPLERDAQGDTTGLIEAYVRPALLGFFVE